MSKRAGTDDLVLVDSTDCCSDGEDQKIAVTVTVTQVKQEAEELVLSSSVSRIFAAPCRDMKLALKEYNE